LEHGGKAAGWNKTVGSLLELVADNLMPPAGPDKPEIMPRIIPTPGQTPVPVAP
jgi:hypothetical protein